MSENKNRFFSREQFLLEISKGNYKAHSLWSLITHAAQRDEYALKMLSFDGAGEYQHIEVEGVSFYVHSSTFDTARKVCSKCMVKLETVGYNGIAEIGKCPKCETKYTSHLDKPFVPFNK